MRAIKANKEYTIDEGALKAYQAEGFDILDDDGKVIAYGIGKTVPYEKYMELKTENEALLKEIEALKAAATEATPAAKKTAKKEA